MNEQPVVETLESNEAAAAVRRERSEGLTNKLVTLAGGEGSIDERTKGKLDKIVRVLMAVEDMESRPEDHENNAQELKHLGWLFPTEPEYEAPTEQRD